MSTLRLILGDQLNIQHSWYETVSKETTYCMFEMRQETDYVKHHIQKVVGFFAAMQEFSRQLISKGHKVIYLSIDDFNKNSNNPFISIFNQSILNDDILARISIKGSHFNMLLDNEMSIVAEPRIYFGPVDIQRLRIRLFDEHGRILHMNNTNFSFCLTIKTMYDM